MKSEDAVLIQRTLDGDDSAFSDLVEKYQKQVHALAWRKIGDFYIIMRKVSHLTPAIPLVSKPISPWLISAACVLLIALMFSISRSSYGNEDRTNQIFGDEADFTRWRLPDGAKSRLGKGMFTDMQITQDGTRLAIASSSGIWIYDIETGKETALLTENTDLTGLVAFSPDGKTLASTRYNTCRIWDVEKQELLLTFKLPDYWIRSIRFLDDGKTLVGEGFIEKVSGSLLTTKISRWTIPRVWLWDSTTGKMLDTFTTELPKFDPITDARTSSPVKGFANPSRAIFAFENKDRTISVMDGRSNRKITEFTRPEQEIRGFVFSADGKRLAIAYDRSVHLWDIDKDEQVVMFPIHIANYTGNPSILSFSKDGKTLAAADGRGITVWNVETQSHLTTFMNVKGGLWEFVLSADGASVVTMDHEGAVDIWSVTNNKHERTLTTGYTGRFTALTFAHNGKTVATASRGKIRLWNVDTGTEKLHLQVPMYSAFKSKYSEWHRRGAAVPADQGSDIISLAFSKNNSTLNTLNISGKIGVLDVTTQKYRVSNILEGVDTVKSLPIHSNPLAKGMANPTAPRTHNIYHLSATAFDNASVFMSEATFSTNGEFLATKNKAGAVEVWDLTIPGRLYTLAVQKNPNLRTNPAIITEFTEDGKLLAIRDGQDIILSDVHLGETVVKFRIPEKKPNIIDRFFSIFGKKSVIHKFDVVTIAQGEKTILAANKNRLIFLWDAAIHGINLIIKGHKHSVCKLALTNDAKILASGDVDGVIHLWEIPSGKKLATFKPYTSPISQLVFSPDGKTLASSNMHSHFAGTILLWDVPEK